MRRKVIPAIESGDSLLSGVESEDAADSSGSASDNRAPDLTAAQLTSALRGPTADFRGWHWTAKTGPWRSAQDSPCWPALNDWFSATNLNSASARPGHEQTFDNANTTRPSPYQSTYSNCCSHRACDGCGRLPFPPKAYTSVVRRPLRSTPWACRPRSRAACARPTIETSQLSQRHRASHEPPRDATWHCAGRPRASSKRRIRFAESRASMTSGYSRLHWGRPVKQTRVDEPMKPA